MEAENNNRTRTRNRRSSQKTQRKPQQEVQYTQPKPFFRKRLLVQLLTIAAVVLAITIGVSIFFKVDTVVVTGASKYSALTVTEASGIEKGDSLLFFGRARAANRIKTELPYVGTVRFELKLPATVNIIIEEKTVSYAMEDSEGTWWKVTSDGKVVEKLRKNAVPKATVTGVQLESPKVGKKAVAAETAQTGETVTATQAERLETAVDILYQLELWEVFEDVTNVDVSDLFALRLVCGTEYRIELGNGDDLYDKLGVVKTTLRELEEKNYGAAVLKLYDEDGKWQVQCNPWT